METSPTYLMSSRVCDSEDKNDNINYHIGLIKNSLQEIKKICKDKQEAYLYKDIIINITNNILFLFFHAVK